MKANWTLRGVFSAALVLSACSGKDDPNATATSPTGASTSKGTDTAGDTTTTGTSGTSGTSSAGTITTDSTDPTDPTDPTDTECNFLCGYDQGTIDIECDIWSQDCPEGEKCMPWANDGGSSWNATKCSPIDRAPQEPGEACTVEGNAVSGIDNCAKDSMCWNVDPETNGGICIPFCEGSSPDNATCDVGYYCSINGDGTVILCLPECDPLLQNCPGDDACLPSGEYFICASGDAGLYGDPCEYANACKPGLYCLNPEYVEDCKAAGCCTPFCDTSKANMCPGGTQECIPWWEEGTAPPGKENIGICGIPQ